MEITTIMGVPAHPLMVHVPVVLVPLSLIGALLMFIPRWRERIGWVTVVLAGAAVGGYFLWDSQQLRPESGAVIHL